MPFRVDRKAFGLTYSCPADVKSGHPIPSKEDLLEFLLTVGGPCKYSIGYEAHEDQEKRHYHAYVKFDTKFQSTNARIFDHCGVHPNIVNGTAGHGFLKYTQKDGDYITNAEQDPFSVAMALPDADQAVDHLWKTRTADMAKFGENIERNIRRRMYTPVAAPVFYGPFWNDFVWDQDSVSLLLYGPPGTGKTSMAKYLLPGAFVVMNTPQALRDWNRRDPLIFDDCDFSMYNADYCKAITDVPNGGTIAVKYGHVTIPPGTKRIFCANHNLIFNDSDGAIFDRKPPRAFAVKIPLGKPRESREFEETEESLSRCNMSYFMQHEMGLNSP